jgi:nitrite reductase/ring-hydroxylating ferredoxin subunit
MRKLTYLCPHTGMHVQIDSASEADRHKSGSHEAVMCQACRRLHFIDVTTGKLLGHEKN